MPTTNIEDALQQRGDCIEPRDCCLPALGLELAGLAGGGEVGTGLEGGEGLAAVLAEAGVDEHVKAEGKLQQEQPLSKAVPDPQD